MRRIVRFVQVQVGVSNDPKFAIGPGESEIRQHLNGYIQNRPSVTPQGPLRSWGIRIVEIGVSDEAAGIRTARIRQQPNGTHPRKFQLKPVRRLLRLTSPSSKLLGKPLKRPEEKGKTEGDRQQADHTITLRPVRSGVSYRITSPPTRGLVRAQLAEALETVFEQFSGGHGFSPGKPLEISLSRGFKANSHGHKEGRAVDIDAVGGKSLLQWKQEWDRALAAAEKSTDPQQQAEALVAEQRRNLGYELYKALQAYGDWRVNPKGWRVYRHVMQLFGPWTAIEGPWKAMRIESPTPEERQRLADQSWVFKAHQDHIHVAR